MYSEIEKYNSQPLKSKFIRNIIHALDFTNKKRLLLMFRFLFSEDLYEQE